MESEPGGDQLSLFNEARIVASLFADPFKVREIKRRLEALDHDTFIDEFGPRAKVYKFPDRTPNLDDPEAA